MAETDHDVVIIGAGPAALSAAVYLARAELEPLVIGFPHESQLEKSHEIDNYLGFHQEISGPELIEEFIRHVEKYDVEILEQEVVDAKELDDGSFKTKTAKDETFTSRALIIATGMVYQQSGIEREDELAGKGIHYCVACDGPFYKDKKVAVIGSGDYAAEEVLQLTDYTDKITILSGSEFDFSEEMEKALEENDIKKRRVQVERFAGEDKLDHLELDNGQKLKFDGVFVAVGTASSVAFAEKLGLEYDGQFLEVDEDGRTNAEKVYAAGGCIDGNVQVAKSVGEGCNAAVTCIKDLKGLEAYTDYT